MVHSAADGGVAFFGWFACKYRSFCKSNHNTKQSVS